MLCFMLAIQWVYRVRYCFMQSSFIPSCRPAYDAIFSDNLVLFACLLYTVGVYYVQVTCSQYSSQWPKLNTRQPLLPMSNLLFYPHHCISSSGKPLSCFETSNALITRPVEYDRTGWNHLPLSRPSCYKFIDFILPAAPPLFYVQLRQQSCNPRLL